MKSETKSPEVLFENIGTRLYYLRHLKKEKITSVAIGVGVSHAVISKIENAGTVA